MLLFQYIFQSACFLLYTFHVGNVLSGLGGILKSGTTVTTINTNYNHKNYIGSNKNVNQWGIKKKLLRTSYSC